MVHGEKAKPGYPVLHSGCPEGIVSGNRNSNTHGKKGRGKRSRVSRFTP